MRRVQFVRRFKSEDAFFEQFQAMARLELIQPIELQRESLDRSGPGCLNATACAAPDRGFIDRSDRSSQMIICSCNVISEEAVRACLDPGPQCPRTPGQVQRCLGCRPQCGSCFRTIRSLIDQASTHARPTYGNWS
jgi:bacterioferritin-associated ferredoxin